VLVLHGLCTTDGVLALWAEDAGLPARSESTRRDVPHPFAATAESLAVALGQEALKTTTRALLLPSFSSGPMGSPELVRDPLAPVIGSTGGGIPDAVHDEENGLLNMAAKDAALADAIASKESFRNLGDTVLLRRYERSRREDIRALMVATDGLQRLFAVPGSLAKAVRNAGMAFVGAQPLVKRWLVSAALG